MWYAPSVVTPAVAEPATVDMVRAHCGISTTARDVEFAAFIKSARARVEKYCGIFVPRQTVDATCDAFSDFENVGASPVASIVKISYVDASGATQDIPSGTYELRLDGLSSAIVRTDGDPWPERKPVTLITVRMNVGFDVVDPPIVTAILFEAARYAAMSGRNVGLKKFVVEGVGSREFEPIGSGAEDEILSNLLEPYRKWRLA
jgi:uncharacterized phiE125 gp8 family phage protein